MQRITLYEELQHVKVHGYRIFFWGQPTFQTSFFYSSFFLFLDLKTWNAFSGEWK